VPTDHANWVEMLAPHGVYAHPQGPFAASMSLDHDENKFHMLVIYNIII